MENEAPEFVYRISTKEEVEELQKNGCVYGRDLDKTSGYFHLSKIDQVPTTLRNFFVGIDNLHLLQVDTKKLGDGLVYEAIDGSNFFPHFYGPDRTFCPLPLDTVTKIEKLAFVEGQFNCSLLS